MGGVNPNLKMTTVQGEIQVGIKKTEPLFLINSDVDQNDKYSGRANFFRGQGAKGLSGHLRRVISLQEGRRF